MVYDSTKDEEIVYRLVTSEESDVSKGLISTTSPIGRGLVGKQVGDVATIVTPNGKARAGNSEADHDPRRSRRTATRTAKPQPAPAISKEDWE